LLGGTTEYRRYRILGQRFAALTENATFILMGRARFSWLEQVGNNLIPPEERFRLGGITTLRGYDFLEVGGPYGRLEQDLNSSKYELLDEQGNPVLDANGQPVFTKIDRRTIGLTQEQLDELQGGGVFERLFNVELLFPLAGENVRGVVFYDAGQVNAERKQYQLLGETEPGFFDLKQSVGAGVRLITPLGVFRFEYGVKLVRAAGESPDKFDFTISTLF
jgi:outer membrane protein insertion porin family